MHNLSFRTLGIDAEYGLRETGLDRLAETISELKSEGAAGWNVTMPCKRAMCDFCDELSPEALISRSVNTVRNENGKLFGYSTDGAGFLRTASEFGYPVKAGAITLLGTGGAAISILIACALEGVERIHVFYNRQSSADRIRPLITQLEEYTKKSHVPEITLESLHDATALDSRAQNSDLIVNATSVGMAGTDLENMSPVSNTFFLNKNAGVIDAIYNPRETVFLKQAGEAGLKTKNGLSMLLYQGAEAFRIWTGQDMPVRKIRQDIFRPLL
jgi:shikimate dehydrogenase